MKFTIGDRVLTALDEETTDVAVTESNEYTRRVKIITDSFFKTVSWEYELMLKKIINAL